jgi:hypothetical protein
VSPSATSTERIVPCISASIASPPSPTSALDAPSSVLDPRAGRSGDGADPTSSVSPGSIGGASWAASSTSNRFPFTSTVYDRSVAAESSDASVEAAAVPHRVWASAIRSASTDSSRYFVV